jgi:hypothetical protein
MQLFDQDGDWHSRRGHILDGTTRSVKFNLTVFSGTQIRLIEPALHSLLSSRDQLLPDREWITFTEGAESHPNLLFARLGWKRWAWRLSPWRHSDAIARLDAVAPFCWSGEAPGEHRHMQEPPRFIASGRRRSCLLFVSRGSYTCYLTRPAAFLNDQPNVHASGGGQGSVALGQTASTPALQQP